MESLIFSLTKGFDCDKYSRHIVKLVSALINKEMENYEDDQKKYNWFINIINQFNKIIFKQIDI